jgi:hypothetical protein
MKLYEIAHSRTGDKGNISTISVIVYNRADYDRIKQAITESRVLLHFAVVGATTVERYEMPQLGALNFVLHDTLGGGVTRSLALDTHGKTLSSLMLEMEI